MATLTASAAQSTSQAKYLDHGCVARSAIYTFTAAQSAGDVIQMVKVPKGAHVHEVIQVWSLGGAALTVTVGDGDSAARYNGSTSTNVATVVRATAGLGYSYSAEDTVDITVGTATSASAAGTVRLTVLYSMDQSTDGSS